MKPRGGRTGVLLERDDELARLGGALRQASGGTGSVVVLAGPLGNGKTALLRTLHQHPDAAGFTTLHAAASLVERYFDYGVVRQLLEPVLADSADHVWHGLAALARPVFDRERSGEALRPEDVAQAVRLGLYTLGQTVTSQQPVLVLVDDLQWVDDSSLLMLDTLARRIQHLRAVLVVTVREGDRLGGRPGVMSVVAQAACRISPRPLTLAASAELLRDRLGQECDPEFVVACHETTGGNPMLLTALALAWVVDGQAPVAALAHTVRTMRSAQARDRLVACMRGLPDQARALLVAMAVLADAGDPHTARTLAGLDEADAAKARRVLRKLGLLAEEGFANPGVRDAVEDLISRAEREDLHSRAVRLLYDNGHPAEQVANQLLRVTVPHGSWAVEVFRVAADCALHRGSPEAAARYLRRALLDTSADGEDRAMVLVDLATVERGFDPPAAVRSISYAIPLLSEARDRAAAAIMLAPSLLSDAPPAVVSTLRDIADGLGDPGDLDGIDRDLALRIEARLRYVGSRTSALELSCGLARLAALGPDAPMTTGAERELLAVLLHNAMVSARKPAAEVAALAERVLSHEPASSPHTSGAAPLLVSTLAAAEAPGQISAWLDQALEAAQQRGDVVEQAMIHTEQSLVQLMSGQVRQATVAAARAFDLGAWDWHAVGTSAAVTSGAVALQLRDRTLTAKLLASAPADQHLANGCHRAVFSLLRASEAAQRGELPGAAALLADCGMQLDRAGWRNPVLFPWRSSLALIKHRLGEPDEAVALAEEERLIAQEWGGAAGIGRAWRVLGALAGGARGVELTRRAVEVLEFSPHRLEFAQALRQWGSMSARADVWRSCLAVALEIGADGIADRARAALGGGAADAVAGLTRSERRVALLAAGGSSNQEIAEALTVTSRAVEKHLTNTYRKLGVRKRAELAEVLRFMGSGNTAD